MRRQLAFFALALLAIWLGGCQVGHVVWLPDSSGFIYTDGKANAKVVHYDLAARTPRVIADLPSQNTGGPAVSPDGKKIALLRIEQTETKEIAQVIILNLSGETLHRSKEFKVGTGDPKLQEPKVRETGAEWSPRGNKLLLYGGELLAGAYDVDKGELTVCPLNIGISGMQLCLGSSIAGDGSGFIGQRAGRPASDDEWFASLVFVDWENRVFELKASPETLAALKEIFEEEQKSGKPRPVPMPKGMWEGAVAVLPWYRGIVRIDCAKHTLSYQVDARISAAIERAAKDGVVASTTLSASKIEIKVLRDGPDVNEYEQIEVWYPQPKEPKRLVDIARNVYVSPAPNGKAAVVSYDTARDSEYKYRLMVVDDQGSILSDFPVEWSDELPNAKAKSDPAPDR